MYYHMQDSPSVSQAHVDDHNVYTASNFHNCYVVNYQTVANLFLCVTMIVVALVRPAVTSRGA